MRFGIPLLGQRVAPRCTIADSVLLVTLKGRRILERSVLPLEDASWVDVARLLADAGVDTLVCGGISRATRESVLAQAVAVIDNVAGTADEVVGALREGGLRSGFGLAAEKMPPRAERDEWAAADARAAQGTSGSAAATEAPASIDCLACSDRACGGSRPCPLLAIAAPPACEESERTLEAAWDVACEDERRLCRLAELVYFALEMGYKRLGVAFCTDLEEPASILTGVLRRFFDVVPVCC